MKRKMLFSAVLACSLVVTSSTLLAGPTDRKVNKSTKLGTVIVNPYKVAPLTAIIRDGGFKLSDASVTVQGKGADGVPIHYKVKDSSLWTYGGIPVFGLYPDYKNTVTVEYTLDGKRVKEDYKIYAPAVRITASEDQDSALPIVKPIIVKKGFEDRLYMVNHVSPVPGGAETKWLRPGGAYEFDRIPMNWVTDTKGDVRWYMDQEQIHDSTRKDSTGTLLGIKQTKDGKLIWGIGQSYMKYDLLGRKVWNRMLPDKFSDFSHEIRETHKGTYVMRVAAADYLRKDGKHVRTVRDHIIEVNEAGDVVDYWDLNEILDPYRDVLLKALDQSAVCINVDTSKQGQTMSLEELEDPNAPFGDVTGVGAGRNWAHVNSVYLDKDDSIIVSSRHQGIMKIGRDKKVKWILASPEGWKGELATKVLKPVDKNGKPIKCENNKCEGDFDWTWTQHTAWMTEKGTLTVFDNGDGRGMEQPALPNMKYSRGVEYKIDEKNMTVQQLWEFGKDRGYDWYSAITSITQYQPDRDTISMYSATVGLFSPDQRVKNVLNEVKYGTQDVQVELHIQGTQPANIGYQAWPLDVQRAF